MKQGQSIEPDIRLRRDIIIAEQIAREVPIAFLVGAVAVCVLDARAILTGDIHSSGYYIADAVIFAAFLVAAFVLHYRLLSHVWAPYVVGATIAVVTVALDYQESLSPSGFSEDVAFVLITVSGGVIMAFRPFLVFAAIYAALTVHTLTTTEVAHDSTSSLATLTVVALAAAAMLAWGRTRNATTLARANKEVERLVDHDPLTGLLNRRGFDDATGTLTALAIRSGEPMFTVVVDVDGFKRINDLHGREVGDTVLRRTAAALRATARTSDIVMRFGNDEFSVVGLGPEPDVAEYVKRVQANLDLTGLDGVWDGSLSAATAVDLTGDVHRLLKIMDERVYAFRQGVAQASANSVNGIRQMNRAPEQA